MKRKYETGTAKTNNDNIELSELKLLLERRKTELYEMQLNFNTMQQELKEKIQVSKGERKIQEKQILEKKLEIEKLQETNKLINNDLLEVKRQLQDTEKQLNSHKEYYDK